MSTFEEQMRRYRQDYTEPSQQITRTTHTIQTEQLQQIYRPTPEVIPAAPPKMTAAERRDAVRKSFTQI